MKQYVFIFIFMAVVLKSTGSEAFWGNDTVDPVSGLNVATGFDVNTVSTVSGSVVSLPGTNGETQQMVMTIAAPNGAVSVVLGPRWFWNKQVMTMSQNQEIAVTGSRAQGKDGKLYLFAQKVENRSSGQTVILRSTSGRPLWAGAGQRGGMRSGDGMRGGKH